VSSAALRAAQQAIAHRPLASLVAGEPRISKPKKQSLVERGIGVEMPKTVPESKFTELQGLDRISPTIHAMKCLWREITKSDFGIDGEIEILTPKPDGKGYYVTGGIVKVQAKSGSSYITHDSDASFAAKSSKEDFELWYSGNHPTVFIIYHPGDDRLYWKEMRSYLRSTPDVWKPPYKIEFSKSTDIFDESCVDELQTIADVSPPRISYTEKEKLFSNLLRIPRIPKWVWSAPCKVSRAEHLWQFIPGYTPPFIVNDKRLYTLVDLRKSDCVFRPHCDTSSIETEPAEDLWEDEVRKRHYVSMLNQLLGRHLKWRGLAYSRDFKRDYFPREDDTSLEFKKQWFNIRTKKMSSQPRTVCKYYEYGKYGFWRHTAANFKFRKFGDFWYLQIVPMYFFTLDGVTPWDSKMVGPYTTRKKASENNRHVLNHVLFWSNVIAGLESTASAAELWLDKHKQGKTKPDLVIELLPTFGIAEFAVPYDPAVYEEEEETIQASLFAFLNQQNEFDQDKEQLEEDEELDEEE